ncbi:hypothetical protein RFN29_01220 [Mesorhizobium sp. VK22B]|uniref:Uncharacterized protein n=1 Tax=Mesorhizobium captivum TaxID=3072319 RepID=A0ABU4YTC9_9HYPH|nr:MULTISPECIES: hypothetical protein [unclassified Mesorhizobium]MDX8490189.1 hypothetical protein [Mesorhizobium sp. VK22B]MDX8508015.1 hypothetical protein [Mesorhizobium sp. VK22E]
MSDAQQAVVASNVICRKARELSAGLLRLQRDWSARFFTRNAAHVIVRRDRQSNSKKSAQRFSVRNCEKQRVVARGACPWPE